MSTYNPLTETSNLVTTTAYARIVGISPKTLHSRIHSSAIGKQMNLQYVVGKKYDKKDLDMLMSYFLDKGKNKSVSVNVTSKSKVKSKTKKQIINDIDSVKTILITLNDANVDSNAFKLAVNKLL